MQFSELKSKLKQTPLNSEKPATTGISKPSISEQTSLLMKKIRQIFVKLKDEVNNLGKDVRLALKDSQKVAVDLRKTSELKSSQQRLSAIFALIADNFKDELGVKHQSELSEIKQTLTLSESKLA